MRRLAVENDDAFDAAPEDDADDDGIAGEGHLISNDDDTAGEGHLVGDDTNEEAGDTAAPEQKQ